MGCLAVRTKRRIVYRGKNRFPAPQFSQRALMKVLSSQALFRKFFLITGTVSNAPGPDHKRLPAIDFINYNGIVFEAPNNWKVRPHAPLPIPFHQ